nr:ribosome-binding protein 1-like isoform X1 [Cherax quadricarinatus]
MKSRERGGKGIRGGRSRGRGAAGRDAGFTRGGGGGGGRSGIIRGRGRGSLRGQNRGGRGESTPRGRGRGTLMARGGRGTRGRGGGGRGTRGRGGRGRGIRGRDTRGRGTRGRGARGRGANVRGRGRLPNTQEGSSSHFENEHQETYQQVMGNDQQFNQQLARRKIQQARRTLATSQQNNRNQARHNIIDERRGIAGGMKQTKGNLGTPLRVRVGSGTIVRGLRSDQLLLHKMKHNYNTHSDSRLNSTETYAEKTTGTGETQRGSSSVVSLSYQRGLTVSIKNNIASHHSQHNGTIPRNRPRLNRNRMNQIKARSYGPATFTVVNDHAYPPEPPFQISQERPRKLTKRNIISNRDPRARMAAPVLNLPPENIRSVPEPHRQILDPKVQKEIAMLQGKDEISLNNGPGPGVKGFRHIPSQTTRSLNERFTEERMVTG